MAEVSMSLAELDELRQNLKEKTEKVEELEKKLVEVEADKRIVKIVEKQTEYRERPTRLDYHEAYSLFSELRNIDRCYHHGMMGRGSYELIGREVSMKVESAIRRSAAMMYVSPFPPTPQEPKITKTYINFEDVQRELREQAEKAVADELGELRAKVTDLNSQLAKKAEKHRNEINELTEQHDEQVKAIIKDHDQKVKDLREVYEIQIADLEQKLADANEAYINLKEDRDARTREEKLEDRIIQLQLELEEARKPWYRKLFRK